MNQQKNSIVLMSREKLDEMKEAEAIVVGETPLSKQEKSHSQMSLTQMIKFHEDKIKDSLNKIEKIKSAIRTRKSAIKDLKSAKEKIEFLQ